jgi:putative tryptophan/tyrosine transport system substrate-binding protein
MRRRAFLKMMSGVTTCWPLAVSAEQTRVTTIGVLVRSAPGWQQFWELFREALRQLGYVEGNNIRFELRTDEGDISRLPDLAAELVRLKVDVIVPWFTPAAIAATHATSEIPIVCAICGDLVGTGLVESLARPGGNVTGNSSLNAELSAKFVELIREMIPSAGRVAVLANAPDPFSKVFVQQIQLAGQATAPRNSTAPFNRWRDHGPMPSSFSPACRPNGRRSWRSVTEYPPFAGGESLSTTAD